MLSLFGIVINVILVSGQYGLSLQEWKTVKEQTQEIYAREFPKGRVKLKFMPPVFTASDESYSLTNKEKAYYRWRGELRKKKRKGIWLVILPPIQDSGSRYIAGYAWRSCFKDINLSPVVVFLQNKNHLEEDRLLASSYVVVHELAHSFNAKHTDTMTIMNPNPLPWVNQYGSLPFDIKSKRKIRRCVG